MENNRDGTWIFPGQIKPYREVIERLRAAKDGAELGDVVKFAYGSCSIENHAHLTAYSFNAIPDNLLYSEWISAFSNDEGLYNVLLKPESGR